MEYSKRQQVIELARHIGILRPRDIARRGLPPEYLYQLARLGIMEQTGRGMYRLAGSVPGESQSLVEACARVPHGVICLLTALRFHGITTQTPSEIWMALEGNTRRPAASDLSFRIIRASGTMFSAGIEEHQIDGVTVRIYNLAKTIVDCFKYRNKIGIEVGLEALREGWSTRRVSMTDLWQYAKIDRVANVMRPYLEMVSV